MFPVFDSFKASSKDFVLVIYGEHISRMLRDLAAVKKRSRCRGVAITSESSPT